MNTASRWSGTTLRGGPNSSYVDSATSDARKRHRERRDRKKREEELRLRPPHRREPSPRRRERSALYEKVELPERRWRYQFDPPREPDEDHYRDSFRDYYRTGDSPVDPPPPPVIISNIYTAESDAEYASIWPRGSRRRAPKKERGRVSYSLPASPERSAQPDSYYPVSYYPPFGVTRPQSSAVPVFKRAPSPGYISVREPDARNITIKNIYNADESVSDDEYGCGRGRDRTRRPQEVRGRSPAWKSNPKTENKGNVPSEERLAFRVNPLAPQDVTVHLSLDATDDLEDALEAHARLRRLGRFDAAIAHFQDRLTHYLDNRYVLVQYGQFLVEAKLYSRLAELARQYPPELSQDALQLNWALLLERAEVESVVELPVVQDTSRLVRAGLDLVQEKWPRLDSTEIQILADAVSLIDLAVAPIAPHDWGKLYQYLQTEDMIWEFRDILQGLEQAAGVDKALKLLLHPDDRESTAKKLLDRLHDDWQDQDESSSFALVDIFTSLSLAYMKSPGNEHAVKRCLEVARSHAALLAETAHNLQSRPYLRWLMANVLLEGYDRPENRGHAIAFQDDRRGDMLQTRRLFPSEPLPIYVPVEDEAPEWRPGKTRISDEAKRTTKMVLRAAATLGDVEMQTACLQELMYQGQLAPGPALAQLDDLWLAAGQMRRHRQKQLFRYMLAVTPAAREQLRRDILVDGEFGFAGFPQYAQYMILRALSPGSRDKQTYLSRAEAVRDVGGRHWHRFEGAASRPAAAEDRGKPPRRNGRTDARGDGDDKCARDMTACRAETRGDDEDEGSMDGMMRRLAERHRGQAAAQPQHTDALHRKAAGLKRETFAPVHVVAPRDSDTDTDEDSDPDPGAANQPPQEAGTDDEARRQGNPARVDDYEGGSDAVGEKTKPPTTTAAKEPDAAQGPEGAPRPLCVKFPAEEREKKDGTPEETPVEKQDRGQS